MPIITDGWGYGDYYFDYNRPRPRPKNYNGRTYRIMIEEVQSNGEIRIMTFEQYSTSACHAFDDAPGSAVGIRPLLVWPTSDHWSKFDE